MDSERAEFTDVDRQPQHPGESFGESDHTEPVATDVVARYRHRDRAADPRHPERMEALRADIAVHGIGNPLVLVHDGDRAVLMEGEHRVAVALEQQLSVVPLRIIRLHHREFVSSSYYRDAKPVDDALRPHLR